MGKVNVFMSCNDNYAPHLCATIAAIVDNSQARFHFGILNQNLSEESKKNISESARGEETEFIDIDTGRLCGAKLALGHISVETYFRYFIPEIKPDMDKAVYLDCDVTVLGDISKLFATDISEYYAGVVEDYAKPSHAKSLGLNKYFNAGAMLFNLKKMREDNIAEKLLSATREMSGKLKYQDQDILNIVLRKALKFLPPEWNASAPLFRKSIKSLFPRECVEKALLCPSIIHFTGPDKPWKIPFGPTAHPYTPVYFYYLMKTPYAFMAKDFISEFKPYKSLCNYISRHFAFFARPRYWRMRKIYKSNLIKYPSQIATK